MHCFIQRAISVLQALRLRTLTAELFAHRAHVRELEDEVHRRRQELARLREEQALLSEQIANCAPLVRQSLCAPPPSIIFMIRLALRLAADFVTQTVHSTPMV